MAVPKYKPPPSTASRLISETRIVNGKSRPVETYNGKVVRVYDDDMNVIEDRSASLGITLPPILKPKTTREKTMDDASSQFQEVKQESQNYSQSQDIKHEHQQTSQLPENKDDIKYNKQEVDDEPVLKIPSLSKINMPENKTEQPKTEIIEEPKQEIQKIDDKNIEQPKIEIEEEPKQEIQEIDDIKNISKETTPISTTPETVQDQNTETLSPVLMEETKSDLPKVENTPKDIPKIDPVVNTIPDISKTNTYQVQASTSTMPVNTVPEEKKINRIDKDDNKINKPLINNLNNLQDVKINDDILKSKSEHGEIKEKVIDDSKISNKPKEYSGMAEEILEEYKRNKWAEERDFRKNIEDMARISQDNKEQISDISSKILGVDGRIGENKDKIIEVEEKIGGVEEKIGGVEQKIGGVHENIKERLGTLQDLQENLQKHLQEKLGDVKKPVSETLGELCTGIDCIKQDLKKSQDTQLDIEKKMDSRFGEIKDRIQKLEIPTYVCDSCGYDDLKPLSSFCPNCGTPIYGWNDPETGNPVPGWSPYWKRRTPFQVASQ